MDPLDFLENEDLLRYFHRNKTAMSCLKNPHPFICQLRDHNLVPEDKYKKMSRMKSKENLKKALYDLLDWLESERPQHIKLFWAAVFKETFLSFYPVLEKLRNDLMHEMVEKEERDGGEQKRLHDDEDEETKSVKRKRKLRSKSMCEEDDEGNAGPWTPVTPTQKKPKICNSPLEKRERGHRKAASYTRQCKKRLKFTHDCASTEEEKEEEEEEEEGETDTEDEVSSATHVSDEEDGSGEREQVFKVTCGAVAATLHQKRFASGSRSKSIRTETCWMTPREFAMEALGQRDVRWKKDIEWEGQPLGKLTQDDILVIHSVRCKCPLCKPGSKELENQKNDDECCICKRGVSEVDLVMCDECPRSFHQKCHLPHVDDSTLRDDSTWLCTFCVFRSNQQYLDEQTMEAAMSRQISQHMLECQYLFLHLCRADADQTFAEDSNLYLKTPMWLRKIADKLQEQHYQTVGEFVSDVDLIFTNCASYNEDDAEFLAYGNRLKELFNEEFKNVFNIQ